MWTKFEAGQVKGSPDELSNIPRPATVMSSCNPSVAHLPSILPVWTTGECGMSEICWASAEPVEWFDRAGGSEARHIVFEKASLGVAHVRSLLLPLPTVWLVVIAMGWMYPEILLGLVDISSVNYGTVSQGLGLGPCIMVGCLSMNRHIVYFVLMLRHEGPPDATTVWLSPLVSWSLMRYLVCANRQILGQVLLACDKIQRLRDRHCILAKVTSAFWRLFLGSRLWFLSFGDRQGMIRYAERLIKCQDG